MSNFRNIENGKGILDSEKDKYTPYSNKVSLEKINSKSMHKST